MATKLIGLYSPAPQSGKSTVAGILADTHSFTVRSFAGPLKRMAVDLLYSAGLTPEEVGYHMHEGKEAPIPQIGGASFRYLTQTLGTEWGRNHIDTDLWVKTALNDKLPTFCVLDDVRFVNEAEAIRAAGGELWRIYRPGSQTSTSHVSEGQLEGFEFDRQIVNDGDYEALRGKVLAALR